MSTQRVLILGGTAEAAELARLLAGDPDWAATLSLAGATRHPAPSPIPRRVGGFGGASGLARILVEHRIDRLIDATHPFASRITANAHAAACETGTPLLRLRRFAWVPTKADRWRELPDLAAAAEAIGAHPKRVFLTVGRGDVAPFRAAPQHHYVIRAIDPPPDLLPDATLLLARGPYDFAAERQLLADHAIDILVTKNSGGRATEAKLHAARALFVPVILVARPSEPEPPALAETAQDALAWLHAVHRGA